MTTTNSSHNGERELLLCFDEHNNIAPPQPRSIAHREPCKIWHAVVNIWVLNSKADILCTHRASHVSGNPGKWQTYLGGHVRSDSNFIETAIWELIEEIGLRVGKDDLKLIEKGRREDVKHVFESYAIFFDRDLSKLNFFDGEIDKTRWLSYQKYQKLRKEKPDDWCNGMNRDQYRKAREILNLQPDFIY